MADVDRYIRHPAAGTSGASGWFDEDRPLGAGRMQLLLGNNLQHLLRENATRVLVTHPGMRNVYRDSVTQAAGGSFSGTPPAYEVQWWYGPLPGGLSVAHAGGLSLCLGTHYVWKIPGTQRLPRLVCRATWWVEANAPELGLSLFVVPGRGEPTWSTPYVGPSPTSSTTATSFEAATNLGVGDVAAVPIAPRGGSDAPGDERGELYQFTAYLGGYCDSGSASAGDRANVLGISLCLEEPT